MQFSRLYPLYVTKVERKGRSRQELDLVISWLTGLTSREIKQHISSGSTIRDFFESSKINDKAVLITGKICGVQIEDITDPLMKKVRYLDKLVDELAKGRPLEKVIRG